MQSEELDRKAHTAYSAYLCANISGSYYRFETLVYVETVYCGQ